MGAGIVRSMSSPRQPPQFNLERNVVAGTNATPFLPVSPISPIIQPPARRIPQQETKSEVQTNVVSEAASFMKTSLEAAHDLYMDCCEDSGYLLKSDCEEYFHLAMMLLRHHGKVLHPELSTSFAKEIMGVLSEDQAFALSNFVSWPVVEIVLGAVFRNIDSFDKKQLFTVDAIPDGGYRGKKVAVEPLVVC